MKRLMWCLAVSAAFTFVSCGEGGETADSHADHATADDNANASAEATYEIDPTMSAITWNGEMIGVKAHFGTIGISSGTFTVKDGVVTGGNFTIDMSSIVPKDENYGTEEYTRDDLVTHLESPDFFDVANHPTATFTITQGKEGILAGELAVRGATNQENVTDITITEDDASITVGGNMTFDRQTYGASFSMGVADMVISDDVECKIKLHAKK